MHRDKNPISVIVKITVWDIRRNCRNFNGNKNPTGCFKYSHNFVTTKLTFTTNHVFNKIDFLNERPQ